MRCDPLGINVGAMKTGRLNMITDVSGVNVGHKTLITGDSVRTGVTAILPHDGNLFRAKTPAAIYCFNSFGKLAGYTQVEELGNIETPIILTNTLSVGKAVEAAVKYTLQQKGNEDVRSVNAVVGETNDGFLNDIRGMHVTTSDIFEAIAKADTGIVEEGAVGAGTGTVAFGYKGGIGTASRLTPRIEGKNYTVGVLVQSNFGRMLNLNGAPFSREIHQEIVGHDGEKGSCMIVIATDAPLCERNLKRLAKRSFAGMARTTDNMTNGSGDYAIAFTTAYTIPGSDDELTYPVPNLIDNASMSILFRAVEEATQEAIYNSILMAEDVTGYKNRQVKAIPIDKVIKITKEYNLYELNKRLDWKPYKYE
jgi:D-aminopeptidase